MTTPTAEDPVAAALEAARAAGTPPRRIRVVWNSNAGSKAGLPVNRVDEAQVRAVMARHRLGDELIASDSEGTAIEATREAVALGYDAVVAAGGDGTVDTIAFELLEKQTALGVLPLGSVMNVARSLGIPRDLEGAAAIIAAGNVRVIDVGEAAGQPFLEIGSVGLNAAIFAEAQRFDKGDYGSFVGLLRTIIQYRPARMVIHLDDRVVRRRALMVVVANGPYGGLGFTFAPDASFEDGLFDVRVYSQFSKTELLHHMWSIMLGRRAYAPKVHTYRSARVRVEAAHPHPVRVDASDLGTTPVTFRTRPRVLRVLAPPAGAAPGAG